jgi:DNA (cytosine-5)-methyltransferase 1
LDINTIPACDIIVGGFPCQSFSTVNPTKDPFDERAQLYKEMKKIAGEKQPKIIIAENVKGFKTLYGGSIFDKVVSAFEKIGYKVSSSLINASDYGVPQKRERVIIVAVRKDIYDIKGEFVFPQKTTENNKVPLSVAVPKIDIEDEKYYFSERAVQGLKKAKNNMKRGLAQNLNEPCLTVTSHLAKTSLNSRDPVLLVDPKKELYRRFTPREAARIQSFPDSFKFADSEFDAYKQIGNAIPPVMFWHIAKSISDYLSNESKE